MSSSIVLVDGPADGRTFLIADGEPPFIWRVALPQPFPFGWGSLADLDGPPAPTPVADYELLREYGLPSRSDTGAYRYGYLCTPEPPHWGQTRPTPTLDELAAMTRDPSPAAYPDHRAHLLACRTRFSLRRDARLTGQERAAVNQVTMVHVRTLLDERHRNPDPPATEES